MKKVCAVILIVGCGFMANAAKWVKWTDKNAPVPTPGDDEALIHIAAAGVCHSDLHLARGDWQGITFNQYSDKSIIRNAKVMFAGTTAGATTPAPCACCYEIGTEMRACASYADGLSRVKRPVRYSRIN